MGDDWELNHVGLVIANRNATLRYLQSIGVGVSVGPQPLLPHEPGDGSLMFYQTLEGDPVTNTYKTGGAHTFTDGNSQIGNCQLECYPMKPGPGMILSEYLAKNGPGVNHICFNSASIEQDTHFFLGRGCDLTFNALVNGATVENYLDTRRHGDMMLSLRPPPSDWERAWRANNQQHPLVNAWNFKGLGIAVHSVEKAVAYYEDLGFPASSELRVDSTLGIRSQAIRVGPVSFDFNEPLEDTSVYTESMKVRNEGVADLIFEVPDLSAETATLESKGVKVIARSSDENSVYFDTREEGNLMLRLCSQNR